MELDTLLISVFLFFTLTYLWKLLKPNKQNLPPSPPKLPVIGNLHQLGSHPHRSLQALSAKYGPVMLLHLGKIPTVVISSGEAVKEILKTHQDVIFAGRPPMRAGDALFYGSTDIALCPYGEYWRQVKKICILELLSQRRVQEFQFVREEEVAKIIEKIRVACQDGAVVDLSEISLSVSNNTVSRSALGRTCEQDGGDKGFGELSRKAMDLIAAFCFKDFFPYLGWIDNLTGLTKSLRDTSKALNGIIDQIIEEHQVSMTNDESDSKDIVDVLLRLQKNGMLDIDLSRDNLKAILLDMFVGGTDTTAAAIEWAMAELVKNPRVMKKAQEEVRKVVGNKSKVSESDINEMSYLKCVVKETLRLHGPALLIRETSDSTKVEGYDIPPKTRVLINAWAVQRDPKVWDRAEEFIPERFADMSINYKDQSGKFIPFGGGRRVCPGMSFALAETEFVLASLLYRFNWSLPNGKNAEDLDMIESNTLIVHLMKPLLVVPTMYCP